MKNYRIIREKLLKNPKIRKEYELLRAEYETIGKIIELRIKNKLTQKQLAEKIGTKQSAISRFEKKMINPTLYTLSQIASAFGKKLVVEFK
ncbi:transcriptional regulator [Candidatus Roizmanbacteria bacterium CG_4_10_14_0_2_um_filter_36_35]|uniref:Transcriptional regulator n=3 Tax=Candidatus Roizmaniibacteriota TaxID=1752723 RepID=A0A2M7BVW3_9BACT|nr:MAG: transcriptional regulator [Candidatus Roizmanbacteria bacterium CG11_big_fil_rev_8_21_14_0_20_35_14]PIV10679.1 MAG: transcriptional regulator [Candidatus Roizmanbacteria bacterium CG03_land_8_20_14_0_80_35_26]PIZ67624.1 MAG: transcriptional regulator [Candidatus Roizmanbacteria bacterium CG_4_10_14_0_2_um_filter_36_35]PJC80264.1 MAG: transcriptional regulator [Candidatus Roizmanbacteria bacterium CG_4_8_14_3_um_filter_36_12]